MASSFTIAVFDGDGIGPEITAPTLDILRQLADASPDYDLAFDVLPAGATHYAQTGTSLPEASLAAADASDAILLSAMGMPDVRYEDGTEISPQIDLRIIFNLFAGVRPVRIAEGGLTPLNLPKGKPVDFVLIRESTEGLFHSRASGKNPGTVTKDEATETLLITRKTCELLFEFSFKLARSRKQAGHSTGKVTCVDKANVFRSFAFFRDLFDEEAAKHPDIEFDHAYVDAVALWMVQKPWVYDVMVTENMFGDILSDLGAGLMGGLGMAPSADIGVDHAVFQPCHGSAPDIAGHGKANPFAMILSAAMMLDWLGIKHSVPAMCTDAERLRLAVDHLVVNKTSLTPDIGGTATTNEAAQAVANAMLVPA